MTEDKHDDAPTSDRSLAPVIAAVATPAAIVAAPVAKAWADQHFGKGQKDGSPKEPKD